MRRSRLLTALALERCVAIVALSALGCQPDTTRPSFAPAPDAARAEIRLPVQEAALRLADALKADSIPAGKVHLQDGWFESAWFDARSGAPTRRRPIGTDVVRVRAWSDPGRPGYSLLTVETVFRPVADPALPDRDLEREVARSHPVAARVQTALKAMADRYGTPPAETQSRQPGISRPGSGEPSDDNVPSDEGDSGNE